MVHNRTEIGFTLIELMFVLTIIGILSSIAVPQYQNFIARSQHAAGLADITLGKHKMEILLNEYVNSVLTTLTIGLPASTSNCDISVNNPGATSTIICTLKGSVKVAGKKITLTRTNNSGIWACTSTALSVYSGKSCQGI